MFILPLFASLLKNEGRMKRERSSKTGFQPFFIHNQNYLPIQLCIHLIKKIQKQNLQIKEENMFK